jgi:alpha-tubulin suppressor-like RCC1 family protein
MRKLRILIVAAIFVVSGATAGAPASFAERSGTVVDSPSRDIAKRFVAGGEFTCLLGGDGTVRCWGENTAGQIGNGNTLVNPVLEPTLVSGISNAVEIAAGATHACALLADKTMKCWGNGVDGQLGDGLQVASSTPVTVSNPSGTGPLTDIRTIGAGREHSCAVRDSDGAVFCWGDQAVGHVGNGLASGFALRPVQVKTDSSTNLVGIRELAVGSQTSCGLKSDGSAMCWGDNSFSQLAIDASISGYSAYAVAWGTATSLVAIDVGGQHVCGFTTGALSCAGGANSAYAFGRMLQQMTIWSTPESSLKQIALADAASCYISSSSSLACAGGLYTAGTARNVWADGNGVTGFFFTSASVSDVRALAAGDNHFCAYFDTQIKCWGANNKGQLGGGSTSSHQSFTTVSAAVAGTLTLADPGSQNVGVSTFSVVGTSNSGATISYAVAAGSASVCSVAANGTVSVLGSGSCVINASAPATGLFTSASASRTVSIAALAPSVTAEEAVDVEFTTVSLRATVNAQGASALIKLVYGTSADFVGATEVELGSQSGLVAQVNSRNLENLSPGTTYHYRFSATNATGSTAGEAKSFATKGSKPTVSTGAASADAFSASLAAEVNANDVDTTVSFEFGTDSTLAKAESASVSDAVKGTTAKAVSASITKLSAATTYHYRVVATNAVGTSKGDIKSFTTKGAKPVAVTGSATRGSSGTTINGKVNPKDLETTYRFDYGTDAKLVGAQQTAAKAQTGAEDVDVSALIAGLAENTTYYYRIVASNVVGTVEGEIRSFTTSRPEGVSINNGEEFTSSQKVTVSVTGPSTAVKAILSNDGGFATSETFDLVNNSADISWTLQSSKEGTFTKIVYVKYVSRFGSQSTPYTDDIILDTTKPVMTTATAVAAAPTQSAVQVARVGVSAKKAAGGVRLSLRGSDTISGIGSIEVRSAANKAATEVNVSRVAGKADGKPRAASQTVTLRTTAKRLQVRVIDRAGNASAWRTITVK